MYIHCIIMLCTYKHICILAVVFFMYFVSVLCVANLALWLLETNKTYLLKKVVLKSPLKCMDI